MVVFAEIITNDSLLLVWMGPQTSQREAGLAVCRITLRTENTARATQLAMATVYAFQLGSGGGG